MNAVPPEVLEAAVRAAYGDEWEYATVSAQDETRDHLQMVLAALRAQRLIYYGEEVHDLVDPLSPAGKALLSAGEAGEEHDQDEQTDNDVENDQVPFDPIGDRHGRSKLNHDQGCTP